MSEQGIGRRVFLRGTAVGAAAMLWGSRGMGAPQASTSIRIEEPFHGAVLNKRHGQQVADGLRIRVVGRAQPDARVTVNGDAAQRDGNRFKGEVILRDKETDIVAVATGGAGAGEHRVRVVWDRHSFPRYRFSIDDNSFFLRDIARKKYDSMFECFYLKMLRKLHDRYGTRFVLNIYYTTEDGFDLTQFPDRYKGEWKDNADWLKLAFHARANLPDRPYQNAPADRLIADLDKVAEQIQRFAGPQTYSPPTVIHWGMVQPTALKPLAGRGVRVLSGYFARSAGRFDVNYLLDDERSEYLSRHNALKDFDSGIVFSRVSIVCNSVPIERVAPTLEPLAKDPNTAEIMDLFTHEQYFWPFYSNYIPDHPQRIEAAVRWVTQKGYRPVFYHEGLLGAPELVVNRPFG